MLNFLRKKDIAKKVLWALAVIIIPAFVLWGAGSLSKRSFPFKYVGSISGRKVSAEEFLKSAKDVQIGLFLNYFSQPEALDKLQKDRKLINRLAWEDLLIKNGARKAGVSVPDRDVVDFITNHPLFTRGGVFNNKFYKYFLANSLGTSPRDFEESVRNFLITAKFKEDIIKNVAVRDEELRLFYRNEFEKARLDYIVLDKNNFAEKAVVSEEEIMSFYNSNKGRFMEPGKIVLRYIAFPHKEQGVKEKILAEMKGVYEKLRRRPRDMEKIAQSLGLSVEETPPFSRDEVVPGMGSIRDIGAVSFGLKPLAEVAPMVDENELGTSFIIMVKERVPSRFKTVEEVTVYIADLIKDDKAKDLARKEAYKLYEEAKAEKIALGALSEKYGFKLGRADFITRFDYIEGIGESYAIIDNAFKLEKGEISKPIEVRKGYALIEPLEFQLIDEKKFEKEKNVYRDKILLAKKMKALQDWLSKQRANSTLNVDLDRI